jgi:hypothetical protein
MATEKGFTRITELVSALNAALRDMEHGRLGAQGLERATEDSRELYERLVVLRHKVREARAAMATKAAQQAPAPKAEPAAQAPIRLDTRPPESHPRQTSLIDAIAEHEEHDEPKGPDEPKVQLQAQEVVGEPKEQAPQAPKAPAAAAPAAAPAPAPAHAPSLAEKLEHAPIADLGKAITLSQKFQFMAELFSGQKEVYEQAITHINGANAYDEAKRYVDAEVLARLEKKPDPETVSSFMDLVQRRFK